MAHDSYGKIEHDEELDTCSACNGSGEGHFDRSPCSTCKGSGVDPDSREYDDSDDYESEDE